MNKKVQVVTVRTTYSGYEIISTRKWVAGFDATHERPSKSSGSGNEGPFETRGLEKLPDVKTKKSEHQLLVDICQCASEGAHQAAKTVMVRTSILQDLGRVLPVHHTGYNPGYQSEMEHGGGERDRLQPVARAEGRILNTSHAVSRSWSPRAERRKVQRCQGGLLPAAFHLRVLISSRAVQRPEVHTALHLRVFYQGHAGDPQTTGPWIA